MNDLCERFAEEKRPAQLPKTRVRIERLASATPKERVTLKRTNGKMTLREGQYVTISYKGSEVEARVVIVSKNQKAVAFGFDAMLGGYVGMMAALDKGDGYRDLIENEPVEVRP